MRLEQLLRGGTPREAAERLAGPAALRPGAPSGGGRDPVPKTGVAANGVRGGRSGAGARILAGSRRAAGTLVGRYFVSRGLDGWAPRRAVAQLRFHPQAVWDRAEDGGWIRAPAMVAAPATAAGYTGGVHVTYLAADGRGKASLDPAKRMWGAMNAPDGTPGGAWLIGPDGEGPLIVGEGIETTLSAAQLYGRPCRAAAALSLRALQGGLLLDRFGRAAPEAPAIDPDRPAFTWPDPGEVWIAVDRDMAPVTLKVRGVGGKTVRQVMDGEARARLCGALAAQWWRRAGATTVRVIAPPRSLDFNAWLKRGGAG